MHHPSKLTPSERRKRKGGPPWAERLGFSFDSPLLLASLAANAVFVGIAAIGAARARLSADRSAPATVIEYARTIDDRPELDSRTLAIARGASPSKRRFTYQDWLDILEREAEAIARTEPDRLYVLAGDSISQWFPEALLPPQADWLNQSISGEGAKGLYDRLTFLDDTDPNKIFVMIGINDLLRGMDDETLLEHQRKIIKDILWIHPDAEVIVQSILPHGDDSATWEGRDRLDNISNDRIRALNDRLAAIAEYEGATFLDLYDLFGTADGKLRPELSTDGLHLNEQGYLVWRTALMVFDEDGDKPIDALTPDSDRVARTFKFRAP
ncbi:MAG: GDSL-type esterase/lipase family protein [Geitlerinemataceae cyanobacterium]